MTEQGEYSNVRQASPVTDKQVKFMRSLKIDIPEGMTKEEARLAIDRVLNKPEEKVEVEKPCKAPSPFTKLTNNHATMYTSYAKDIFCCLREHNTDLALCRIEAIETVKKFKEAFE